MKLTEDQVKFIQSNEKDEKDFNDLVTAIELELAAATKDELPAGYMEDIKLQAEQQFLQHQERLVELELAEATKDFKHEHIIIPRYLR